MERLLKYTTDEDVEGPQDHLERENLEEALHRAKTLCAQVRKFTHRFFYGINIFDIPVDVTAIYTQYT